jgi:hypothetical protein
VTHTTIPPLTARQAEAVQILVESWPCPESHRRNKAYLALCGGLLRSGLPQEQIEALTEALTEATGDEEASKRLPAVASTAAKLKDGKPVTGWPSLVEILGPEGERVVTEVKHLLGLTINLDDLAAHKQLPVEFLEGLGLHDLPRGGVGVPYCTLSGKAVIKERTALSAGDGSYWPKGEGLLAYGEDRLDADSPLALVEGESDCWTMWFHGQNALGLPGADTVARTLHLGHVANVQTISVVEEPDGVGKDFVRNVRRRLGELGWDGALKVVRLAGAKDPSELHCQDPGAFKAAWRRALESAEPAGVTPATTADPLPPEPPWPDPPDAAAYYGLAGDVVRVILPHSEADAVALLAQTLVAFGNAIGRTAHFRAEGDTHYLNEFAVLMGKTSKGRKGTSWGHVKRLFKAVLDDWLCDRVQGGASSGEGLIWAVRDPIQTRQAVKEKGRVVAYEEVESDAGVPDKRLLLYEPEFASVLKQLERQGNTLSTLIRQAWESGNLRSLTKNSPARATGAHVSIVGHITAAELRRYLTATESANGFGNRFLWLCVRRSKALPRGGRIPKAEWDGLVKRLAQAHAFAITVGEMTLDAAAWDGWCAVYEELSEGRPGLAGAMLSRGEAHVLRLACLYALLDRSAVVRLEHLEAALALWEYVEASVEYVFGASTGDPLADEILRALRCCPDGLSRTEVSNLFQRNQQGGRIGQALALLLQAGLAHPRRQDTGGRPTERWFAGRAATKETKDTKEPPAG